MKPNNQFPPRRSVQNRPVPLTDCFFHSSLGDWHGHSSSPDGDDRSRFRNFHRASRDFLVEAARERFTEMTVFALVTATSAWTIIYMVITVVSLMSKPHP